MLPIFTLLKIDKAGSNPLHIQISNQLTEIIRAGTFQRGQRLPSTRQLAQVLLVHRKTIVQAYDELLAQGWLESRTGSGTFVSKKLPDIKLHRQPAATSDRNVISGFQLKPAAHLFRGELPGKASLHLDDGFPDARLAPLKEIARAYRSQLLLGNPYEKLGYSSTLGSSWLRQELSLYLNETRGLNTSPANILITRGTMMGMYLASNGLLDKGDHVVVTEAVWSGASVNFIQTGAVLHVLHADDGGIDTDALEQLCTRTPIRLVYVTTHHHYPTTVVLKADRRLHLLSLAQKFGFIILEDDYDYDFHYQSKPLLPLAGADKSGMVIYCGSFTKTLSPAFRVGYLIGPENVITHLAQFRRIVDRQGDVLLENTLADLLKNGVIQRHLRKSLRLYRERRDFFCKILKTELIDHVAFKTPEGGMAVWAQFNTKIATADLAKKAFQKGLYFSDGAGSHVNEGLTNGTRLGFASSNTEELYRSVEILKGLL